MKVGVSKNSISRITSCDEKPKMEFLMENANSNSILLNRSKINGKSSEKANNYFDS